MRPMREPREWVDALEAHPSLPSGSGERFGGYGVMGLPFRSGHLLALRRLPASSIGPGYRSVWHRDPQGRWTFFQDVSVGQGCTRYFGADLGKIGPSPIPGRLGDFRIPQRGVFAIGRAFFETSPDSSNPDWLANIAQAR